ncbi:DsbA family oxidoreductase [Halobacillus halophilus]|uniref:DsbA family oxidoreductase n=1 Tax=Halobacillus halophilus TaxID=1570 RepID=UPI001CD46531|nr:DsbA family oxidoreductase [Halobacillus halophilus]MCA1010818.1 DsbA family oxidoreductase [Halobacillus halophilus]
MDFTVRDPYNIDVHYGRGETGMKIEIWSDFVCPFCYIGKRRLEQALENFPNEEKAEVVYKSFELDPNAERSSKQSMHEKLAAKYGRSLEEAKEMTRNMEEQASMVGLDFRFDTMVPTNTMDAHRVAKFAETKGLDQETAEVLFRAVFTDSKDIGDHETLIELAQEAGLDQSEVRQVLESTDYMELVRTEETEAHQVGVQGVPFFVINRKYAVSGAQPIEIFTQALEKAYSEEKQTPAFETFSGQNGAACTDDSCE